MSLRRFSITGRFAALFSVVVAVMFLAAAPVLAGGTEAQPHGMTMAAAPAFSDPPCAAMADHSGHSQGKHAKSCLALCLVGHGALLPETLILQTAWLHPAVPRQTFFASEPPAHPPGVDPPPPRRS
jgi:hypothetical protein